MSLIRARNVKLYCRIVGEGQPCILLHGSFVDGSFWKEQISALGREFRAIVPDLRGHGLSEKPSEEYSPEVMARDIMNLARALAIEQASLIGHSMGARIALQFALDYPKLVRKLVLAGGSAGPIQNREDIFPNHVKEEIGIGTPRFDLKKYNYYEVWYSFANPTLDQANGILRKIAKTPDHVKSSIAKNLSRMNLRPRLPQIQVPTLVIVGEKDVICPVEESAYLAHHLRRARLEIVPDSGHCLPIERPNAFNDRVVAFMKDDVP